MNLSDMQCTIYLLQILKNSGLKHVSARLFGVRQSQPFLGMKSNANEIMRLLLWRAESLDVQCTQLAYQDHNEWVKLARTPLEARRRLSFPHNKTARPSMRHYVDLFRAHCFNYRRALLDRRTICMEKG